MLDLFEPETDQALARLPRTQVPEAGIFDGFIRGTGMAAVRTGIKTVARPLAMIGSIGAAAYDRNVEAATGIDTISDGSSARDKYFKSMDDILDSAIDYWTPKPAEVGVAGEVVGQLLGLLPIVIASPATAIAGTYLDTATELSKKGVDDWRAQAVGAAQAVGLGTGIWMPILGANLWQRVLAGGAGFNALQGIVTRGAAEEILKGHPAGEEFKALDGTALTLDVLLGMAFGSIAHLSPTQRAQGAKAWERIRGWAEDLDPSQKAAIAVLREAQHLNADSLAGKPAEPADVERSVNRTKLALEQAVRGEPTNVEDLPAPKLEPDPARLAEAEKRVEDMRSEGDALAKAYDLVLQEPIGPAHDPLVRLTPEEIGDVLVERGPAFQKQGSAELTLKGFGLVKIIWKHGEKSKSTPKPFQVQREDVTRLPEVLRDFMPIVDETQPDGKRLLEWQVEREDGKKVIYSVRGFSETDGAQHLVSIFVNQGKTDFFSGKPLSEKRNRFLESPGGGSKPRAAMAATGDTGPGSSSIDAPGGQESGSQTNSRTEGPAGQPRGDEPPPDVTGGKPAGPEAEKPADPATLEAQRFAEERPDLPVRVGTTPDGEPMVRSLKDFLGDARSEVDLARKDATLFEAAAACMLGVS